MYYPMYVDPTYILIIIGVLLSLAASTKVKSTFGITVPYWKDSLQKCIHELKQQSAY